MYSEEDGRAAVRLSREALDAFVLRRPRRPIPLPVLFQEKTGAFVTLNRHPGGDLRGCIGYPSPFFSLEETLIRAAEGAAEDPRFPPLREEELLGVVVEASLLTPPKLLETARPKDLPGKIQVGRDGLVAARGRSRGVLLPQVAAEWGWSPEEFLSQVCVKTGLPPEAWQDGKTLIYAFQAELFSEVEPRGAVARRALGMGHASH